jgi:hypothetical protein
MFDQLSAEILASLIKGFPRTTTTTKQNVDPAVHFVYSWVKTLADLSATRFDQNKIQRKIIF